MFVSLRIHIFTLAALHAIWLDAKLHFVCNDNKMLLSNPVVNVLYVTVESALCYLS